MQDSIRNYTDVMNGAELAKQLLAEVHRSAEIRTSDNDTHEKLDEIKKILEGLDKNITKEIKELGSIERNLKDLARGPGSGGSAKPAKTKIANIGGLAAVMTKTYTAINNLNKTLLSGITVNMAKAMRPPSGGGVSGAAAGRTGGGGGGGGKGGGGGTAFDLGSLEEGERRLTKINTAMAATNMVVNAGMKGFDNGLQAIGVNWRNAFQGIAKQGVQHVQDMRAFLYTTQGAGVAMTDLEKKSIMLNNVAAETGKTWGEAATLNRKEMQKGLTTEVSAGKVHTRTAADAMRLTKNSLRTANMIGASAENTAELFSEWNRHLGMTNEQLGFVGREMEQVARNSGVTGDELLAATKAASVLVKEVRNFAGISQQAMGQIIQTQASLQKFGAEDIGAKFNHAMSQGVRTLSQAEPVIASIIAESAQRAGVSMTGSMLTGGAQQRKMQQEIMKTLRGRLGSIGLGGVDPTQLLDKLEELRDSGQDTGMLEQQIKNITGMGAGELQSLYKSYQEASMTFSDRMKGFEDRINNATSPEGKALAQQQKSTFVAGDQRQQLSTFSDILGRKGDMNEAVKQFNQRMQREGRGDAMLSGPDAARQLAQRGVTNVADRAKSVGVDFNSALKKRGMTKEGLERGLLDPKSSKEFAAILQEVENEVMTQEKANQDPVLKANLELAKINEKLTSAVTKLYMAFASFELIMGAAVALMAAKAGMSLMSLGNVASFFGKGGRAAGRLLGIGGKAVAGEASLVAGEAVAGRVAGRAGGAVAGRAGGAVAGRAAGAVAGRAGAGGIAGLLGGVGSKLGIKALVGGGAKVAGAGLSAALGASTGGISLLVTALLGGFIGAMDAAGHATEIFNKKQEDLTYTEVAAAKTAGFLTGTLDFITFGLFDKWLGPTGTWTIALAKFFDNFWPLALLFDLSLKPLEIIWGLLKGIWFFLEEMFDGIWEGIKAAWGPINEAFMQFKNEVMMPLEAVFKDVFGFSTGAIDVVKIISESLRWLGKQAGALFKFLGETFGKSIKMMLPIIKGVAQFIGSVLVPAFQAVFKTLKGVWNVLAGIFTLDGDKIMDGLGSIFTEIPNAIAIIVKKTWDVLVQGLPLLGELLWKGIKGAFWLAIAAIKALLWDFPQWVGKQLISGFMWLVTDLPKLLYQGFVWIVDNVPQLLWEGFKWLVTGIAGLLVEGFKWLVVELPNKLATAFTEAMNALWEWVKEKVGLGTDSAGGKTVSAVSKAASGDFSGAASDAWGATKAAGGYVLDKGKKVVNGLADAGDAVLDFIGLDVGTKAMSSDGLAYLHKGEMVIPPDMSGELRAGTSAGPFDGDTFVGRLARQASNALGLGLFDKKQGSEAMDGGMTGWVKQVTGPAQSIVDGIAGIFGMGGGSKSGGSDKKKGVEESLGQIVENSTETNKILHETATMLNTGLFDNNSIADAIYETSVQSEKQFDSMFGSSSASEAVDSVIQAAQSGGGIMDKLTRTWEEITGHAERASSNPVDSGLFSASNSRETFYEAMKNGISNSPIGSLMDMFGVGSSKTSATAGNSLYYNKESEYQQATTQAGATGGTTNNFVNQSRRVRGLPVKGGVNTNMLANAGDVEDFIVQSQLLNQPSGGGGMAMPILERIADAIETGRLDEIILLLTAIRDKSSDVLISTGGGGGKGGAPSVENSNLHEGYNKSWLNGDWTHMGDPSYSDNANILGTARG